MQAFTCRAAEPFAELQTQDGTASLSHAEWLGLLVDREASSRATKSYERRLRPARLRHVGAVPEACGLSCPAQSRQSPVPAIADHLDDWGPDRLNASQRRDLMEIVEDRYEAGSVLITSQLPVDAWHDVIGEPTFADAILDRIAHNAYRLNLDGQSMWKTKISCRKKPKTNRKNKRPKRSAPQVGRCYRNDWADTPEYAHCWTRTFDDSVHAGQMRIMDGARTRAFCPDRYAASVDLRGILGGSALTHHPHIYMIVPGGGLSPDGTWRIACRPGIFLHVRVLSRLFRRFFLEGLLALHRTGNLAFFGDLAELAEPSAIVAYLAPLRKIEWVVYAKPPFGGLEAVLAYLSRYTHRVAISNSRLISADAEIVAIKWKDYRIKTGDRRSVMRRAYARC